MSYETVTLNTVVFTRRSQKDDSASLLASDHAFDVPHKLDLARTFPKVTKDSNGVLRGSLKVTKGYKDATTGKVHYVTLQALASVPSDVPSATVAAALDDFQAAIATEALAADVLTKGVVY